VLTSGTGQPYAEEFQMPKDFKDSPRFAARCHFYFSGQVSFAGFNAFLRSTLNP
jgi:hypothetical protein